MLVQSREIYLEVTDVQNMHSQNKWTLWQ